MKKQVILLFITLILSLTLVSAVCTETDSGRNIGVKGTATGSILSQLGTSPITDTCVNEVALYEYYCDNYGTIKRDTVICSSEESPSGEFYTSCNEGACTGVRQICGNGIKEGTEQCDDGNTQSGDGCSYQCLIETTPITCSDTDNGKYFGIRGTATLSDGSLSRTDFCAGNSNLLEYYCDGNQIKVESIICSIKGFYSCDVNQGKCITQSDPQPTCVDTDNGINFETPGSVIIGGNTVIKDGCMILGNIIFERYCDAQGYKYQQYNCNCQLNQNGQAYCATPEDVNPVIPVSPTSTCEEIGDAGSNPLLEGSIIITNSTGTFPKADNCISATQLQEYSCLNHEGQIIIIDCTSYGENYTCEANACKSSTSCTDTDGGANYYSKGTAIDSTGTQLEDSCEVNGPNLNEAYCHTDGTAVSSQYYCPEGCDTVTGACRPLADTLTVENFFAILPDNPSQTDADKKIEVLRELDYSPFDFSVQGKRITDITIQDLEDKISFFINNGKMLIIIGSNITLSEADLSQDITNIAIEKNIPHNVIPTSDLTSVNDIITKTAAIVVTVTPPSYTQCPNQANGLIAYYTFDENTVNAIAVDKTSNNYHGGQGGQFLNITSVQGKRGKAASFPGLKDTYLNLSKEILNNRKNITLSLWIKTQGSGEGIFSAARRGEDNELLISHAENLRVHVKGSRKNIKQELNDNNWHNIIITLETEEREMKTYVDGELKATDRIKSEPLQVESIVLGQNQYRILFFKFQRKSYEGLIDEISVFNKVLSEQEVESLYNTGVAPNVCTHDLSKLPVLGPLPPADLEIPPGTSIDGSLEGTTEDLEESSEDETTTSQEDQQELPSNRCEDSDADQGKEGSRVIKGTVKVYINGELFDTLHDKCVDDTLIEQSCSGTDAVSSSYYCFDCVKRCLIK